MIGIESRAQRVQTILKTATLYAGKIMEHMAEKCGGYAEIQIAVVQDGGLVKVSGWHKTRPSFGQDVRTFVMSEVEEQGEALLLRHVKGVAQVFDSKVLAEVLQDLETRTYADLAVEASTPSEVDEPVPGRAPAADEAPEQAPPAADEAPEQAPPAADEAPEQAPPAI